MVKLVSVRRARHYGPPDYRETFEMANAAVYFVATVLLLVGTAFQLPDFNNTLGLILILVALLLLIAVNLHDFHAQLAGIEFQMDILRLDKQLAYVELPAPALYAIGSALLFVGVLFLLRISDEKHYFWISHRKLKFHSMRLLVSGAALWLLGSILNSFQVYERTSIQLQAYQKSVLVPFLIASTLYLLSTMLGLDKWPVEAVYKVQAVSVWFAVVASALLVLAAIMNMIRVLQVRQTERMGGLLEPLRGGAQMRSDTASLLQGRSSGNEGVVSPTTVVQPERLY